MGPCYGFLMISNGTLLVLVLLGPQSMVLIGFGPQNVSLAFKDPPFQTMQATFVALAEGFFKLSGEKCLDRFLKVGNKRADSIEHIKEQMAEKIDEQNKIEEERLEQDSPEGKPKTAEAFEEMKRNELRQAVNMKKATVLVDWIFRMGEVIPFVFGFYGIYNHWLFEMAPDGRNMFGAFIRSYIWGNIACVAGGTFLYMYCKIHFSFWNVTYIPTYLHGYIPTYLRIYNPTNLHTYIPTYLHTYMTTYLHTYAPKNLNTYIPTYLNSKTC